MLNKFKLLWIVCSSLMVSPAVMAVDLVGVHDLALKSDPRLKAAEYRREATAENKTQAWSNLLPQLGASGNWNKGNTKTTIPDLDFKDERTKADRNYGLRLQQSLYDQANYEQLDVARGQITQADAIYQTVYLDFLLRVSDSYFIVLTLMDGVTFAEAEELALKRQYEQAEQRFEVGLTAVTDVHFAGGITPGRTRSVRCRQVGRNCVVEQPRRAVQSRRS
jgi:outer membrane protein